VKQPLTIPRAKSRGLDVSLSLVNVVLLLVFFFIVSGQMSSPTDGRVELSSTRVLPLGLVPSPVLVVTPDGEYSLDGLPVAPDLLASALAGLPRDAILHVLMDRDEPAASLLTLLDQAQLAEIGVRLVTIHQREGQ
jgi:biopolymer transport protein ExbD